MTASSSLPQGKVTLLFTDIEDSTPAITALGNDLYLTQLREPHFRILRACLQEQGGVESGTPPGDGLLAVFQTPDAAVACAKAMQEQLQRAALTYTQEGQTWTVRIRIGVHTAERQMSPDAVGHYHGEDIHLAARVMSQGRGGQVLVSPTCYKEAGSRQKYRFQEWPDRWLKGYARPASLYEMLWQPGQKPQEPGTRWIPDWARKYADAYIERKRPMREIFDWLESPVPMLIVHGPGGTGKTRLSVQAVLRMVGSFEGRVYGIALDKEFGADPTAVTPELLASALARASHAPQEVQDNPLQELKPYLESRGEILLFLDNAESVFNDDILQWLAGLVPMLWSARWIVSSRHDPGLPDIARPYPLDRLETPQQEADLTRNSCFKLFKARLEERRLSLDLTDTKSLVQILQHTSGFPLAVEHVAQQRQFATLREIVEGLDRSLLDWQRIRGEAGQRRGEDDRHETMYACIHWSVQMLPEAEQAAYARLHLFAYDFDAPAAKAIADISPAYLTHWQTTNLLDRLETNGTTRYRLLPVYREYAERLSAALQLDTESLCKQYVDYYAALADANRNINIPAQKAVLDSEWRSMSEAAERTDDATALLRLSEGLRHFFYLSIYGVEGTRLHERACRAAHKAINVLGEANCIQSLGDITLRRSDHDTARTLFEKALPLFKQVGSVVGEANCIKNLGDIASDRSDHDAARQRYEQALPLYRQAGSVLGEANCIKNLGNIALDCSDQDTARQRYEQALPLFKQTGSILGEANCIRSLGDIALRRTEHEIAHTLFETALPLYRQVGSVLGEANCIRSLGDIAFARSDHDTARTLLENALRLYAGIPEPYSMGLSYVSLARLCPEGRERTDFVRAARAAWTDIRRDDLVKQLDAEFGR